MHKANMSRAYNWRTCIRRTCIRRTKFMGLKFKENLKKIIGILMSGGPVREGEVSLPILLQSWLPLLNHILWKIKLYTMSNLVNCKLFNLSSYQMVHIFKWYPRGIITKYNWTSSSNLNLSCSLLTVNMQFHFAYSQVMYSIIPCIFSLH